LILGIEAVNIRSGGGLKHLKKFLKINSEKNYFKQIVVYTNSKTKMELKNISGVKVISKKAFDLPYSLYIIYQMFFLKNSLIKDMCDIVFVPGSIFFTNFKSVLMPQNMLPYEKEELKRFLFFDRLKFYLIGFAQKYSLKNANGVIYLSKYAKNKIQIFSPFSKQTIIPHGINENSISVKLNNRFTKSNPMQLLYVSPLYPYKHHNLLVTALEELIDEGLFIDFQIIGGGSKSRIKSLEDSIKSPSIKYIGEVNSEDVSLYYRNSDVFIFASTCENLPITLLEAMSHGLPIICSNYGVMQEVLNYSSEFFFNPTEINSIKETISKAYNNIDMLNKEAKKNKLLSSKYNWNKCIDSTNKFLKHCY
jgi:glycosyltransferase involved in cell wall biosynthesis